MNLGTSQIHITPAPGGELSGFAARIQPSSGVLDRLYAKALYLECDGTRLLWLHCDLVGFDRSIVQAFRDWAREKFDLAPGQVMLSATHTHAGPGTVHLREAGEYDPAYVQFLQSRIREAAEAAISQTEPVGLTVVEGHLSLAVDRRKAATAHTDPRVAGIGFRRADGSFATVLVNYAIHPVALGSTNRCVSTDLFGEAALRLAAQLPGHPVVFMTNGACANLNPPAENVSWEQVKLWGRQIADAVQPLLADAPVQPQPRLQLLNQIVPLPLDTMDAQGINEYARRALQNERALAEWGDKYRRVVEHWRTTLLARYQLLAAQQHDAELFGMQLGGVILMGANAEIFSQFTDILRAHSNQPIYLVGYANGDMGYLPTRAAYAEGGYEVDVAHLFYGGFRPQAGGLELLAKAATDLVRELGRPPETTVT